MLHTLKQLDGSYVTRIYGINDNPKSTEVTLFGKPFCFRDVWDCNEHNLWNAKIYPVCSTRKESINAALNLYEIANGSGDKEKWLQSCRVSLFSSFCNTDVVAIQKWQQSIREKIKRVEVNRV